MIVDSAAHPILPVGLSDSIERESSADVVVIGGGPAGALFGYLAARHGVQVVIVEKDLIPRTKVCGGCLSSRGLGLLQQTGLAHIMTRCRHRSLELLRLHHRRSTLDVHLPPGEVIVRSEFDAHLISSAIDVGCAVLQGVTATVQPYRPDAIDRVVDLVDQAGLRRRLRARLVVIATGLSHPGTLDSAELPIRVSANSRVGFGGTISIPDNFAADTFFTSDALHMFVADNCYLGVVQVNGRTLNIAGASDPRFLKEVGGPQKCIAAMFDSFGLSTQEIISEAVWRGTPHLSRQCLRPAGRRVIAIGDRVGYCEPFTGEGMTWAFESAAIAVDYAIQGLPRWSPSLEQRCSDHLLDRWGRQQRHCRALSWIVRSAWMTHSSITLMKSFPRLSHLLARRAWAATEHQGKGVLVSE